MHGGSSFGRGGGRDGGHTDLCLGSVTGGIFVSVRNQPARISEIFAFLTFTATGAFLIAGGWSLWSTLLGAVVIGFVVPLLGTHISRILDHVAPADKRASVFSILKAASSVGIIPTSAMLALAGLHAALTGCAILTVLAAAAASVYPSGQGG